MNHRGIELDIFSHAAELVSVFEFHADVAALVNFDMVWQGADGYWRTYLPDKQKGRIQKRSLERDNVEQAVIDYLERTVGKRL